MKFRLLAVAGGVAGLGGVAALGALAATPALAAGANSGSCVSNTTPSLTNQDPLASQGGPDVGDSGSTSGGEVAIWGSHGYLQASGSTSGGTISGYQTESGLNGSLTVGSSPSVCIGVAGAGGVSAAP